MNIQRKNSAHHFRMQSEREQTWKIPIICSTYLRKIPEPGEFAAFWCIERDRRR